MAGVEVEETTGDRGGYSVRYALPYETAWFTAVHRVAAPQQPRGPTSGAAGRAGQPLTPPIVRPAAMRRRNA
jgi:hypothetical protein